MSPSIRDQVDLEQVAGVALDDPEAAGAGVLGRMVFYGIADVIRVRPDELAELFERHRLDPRHLPKPIDPAAALKSAIKTGDEVTIGVHTYEVGFTVRPKDDGSLLVLMTRERTRSRAERVELAGPGGDYRTIREWEKETVARLAWTPEAPETLDYRIEPAFAEEYPYEPIIGALVERWDELRQYYGGEPVSRIVREILNETMSVLTRPTGGVWLVPPSSADLLERVEALVHELDEHFRKPMKGKTDERHCEFDSIILVDRERNRMFVRTKVEAEISAQMERATIRLYELIDAGRPPSPATLSDYARIRRKALAYRDGFAAVYGDYDEINEALARFEDAYRRAARLKPAADSAT